MTDRSTEPSRALGVTAVYAVLCVLVLSPLFVASVPPLVDYPNHLARMAVLLRAAADPVLGANYLVHWQWVPNLAMDLVVPPLAHVMPLDVAGRVFIALAMLAPVAGAVAIHRALWGRAGLWPASSFLFVYNADLSWGFVNFLFGSGLALVAFGGWIASARWARAPRVAAFAVVAVVLLYLHLFGFCLYGLLVGAWELGAWWRAAPRRAGGLVARLGLAAQFVPGLALWYIARDAAATNFTSYYIKGNETTYLLLTPVGFGDPVSVSGVVPPPRLEVAMMLFCAVVFCIGLASGMLRFSRAMILPVAALFLAAAAMPAWLLGSAFVNLRLPVMLAFVVVASLRVEGAPRRLAALTAGLAAGLLLLRLLAVDQTWHDLDRKYDEFRAAARLIVPGSRLLVAGDDMPTIERFIASSGPALGVISPPEFYHLPALAVIDRSAFMPYLFTGLTSIKVAPRNAHIAIGQDIMLSHEQLDEDVAHPPAPDFLGQKPYWLQWRQDFDYLVWFDWGRPEREVPAGLEPIAKGSYFTLYRIRRAG